MQADISADILALDRGEPVALMEPLLITGIHSAAQTANDLAFELAKKSSGLRRSLPFSLGDSLADLVREMNCYYSNLIEDHYTHPIDIARALRDDFNHDTKKRNLQLEAKAHVEVQRWIDQGGLSAQAALSVEGVREIHRRFCSQLPKQLLMVEDPAGKERLPVKPGEFRLRDVQVGGHVAVSPGAVPRFLTRFAEVYGKMSPSGMTVAVAAMHHRFLWIHPFLDGNGRVARLVSHAVLMQALDSGCIWSVARGLARNVQRYKELLANCDLTRRNDLDGRGNLSEAALVQFTIFFLEVCLDQVDFMERLIQPSQLLNRIQGWAQEESRAGALPQSAGRVLEAVIYRGELPRGEVANVTGTVDRQARRIVAALVERGVLRSENSRSPLRLVFPAELAHHWLPGMFPEYPD